MEQATSKIEDTVAAINNDPKILHNAAAAGGSGASVDGGPLS